MLDFDALKIEIHGHREPARRSIELAEMALSQYTGKPGSRGYDMAVMIQKALGELERITK